MKLSKQASQMIVVVALVNVIACLIYFIYYRTASALPFVLGIILGSITSLFRVFILEITVNNIVYKNKNKNFAQFSHLGRLFLVFIVLLIGALVDGVSLFGVIIGIFSYQIATYSLFISENKNNRKDKNNKIDD